MESNKAEEKLNFLNRLPGDKVVWIIVTLLSMISLVCIFSSTQLIGVNSDNSRFGIMVEQFVTIGLDLLVILGCFQIRRIKWFKLISKYCFALTFILLLTVVLHLNLGFAKAVPINGAYRVIRILGFQVHVYEVAKVAMVMYLAWAVDTYKKDGFLILPTLARIDRLAFLGTPLAKVTVYILLPIITVTVMILAGGASSAIFTAAIMVLTVLIGGVDFKYIFLLGVAGCLALGVCAGLYFLTKNNDDPLFNRIGVVIGRLSRNGAGDNMSDLEKFLAAKQGSEDYYNALDQLRQPKGARLAVKEGGLLGKGPGQSTQKYVVSDMDADYMFSFIVEEYGILGAIVVLMLYISLLARGSLIARNCDNNFAKVAVAGLCLLITGQAMFHISVNLDLGFVTGQTLPMISHGTSSSLCFAAAFGIILSISRMAEDKIQIIQQNETPLVPESLQANEDELGSSLNDLDNLESGVEFTDNDIL